MLDQASIDHRRDQTIDRLGAECFILGAFEQPKYREGLDSRVAHDVTPAKTILVVLAH